MYGLHGPLCLLSPERPLNLGLCERNTQGTNGILGNPFAHIGKMQRPPSKIYVANVHFDLFNQYWYTGDNFQSHLDIFRFDFMFVKTHDVSPMFCFNVQSDMRFSMTTAPHTKLLQLLSSGDRSGCNENLLSVCSLKPAIRGTSRGLINIKSIPNMSRCDWKCSPLHKCGLNQSNWAFSTKISEGGRCIFPNMGEWFTRRE